MQVRMNTTLVWYGYEYHAGDVADLPDDVATRYIVTNQAEPISPPIETAALQTTPPKGRRDARIQNTRARA